MSESNKGSKYSIINWASTIIGIILGLLALFGWLKQAGVNEANAANIALQTQKQWELRQGDQIIISAMIKELAQLKADNEWLKKAHKVVDIDSNNH